MAVAAQEETVVTVPPPTQTQTQTHTKIVTDSPVVDHHDGRGGGDYSSSYRRSACACIAIFLLLAGITALVVWVVYRPHSPRFAVVGAAVYQLNTTAPPLISTAMQFTILARNPNGRVSLRYDRLVAYVSYRGQPITAQVPLPPMRQGKKTTLAVSPVLGGEAVPVSVEVANGLAVDQTFGAVGLRLVLTGRIRYKAGAIKTVRYGLRVHCDILVGLRKGLVGQVPLLSNPLCKVDG